jgi:hypothetical protein
MFTYRQHTKQNSSHVCSWATYKPNSKFQAPVIILIKITIQVISRSRHVAIHYIKKKHSRSVHSFSSQLASIVSQTILIHTRNTIPEIHFNIILPSTVSPRFNRPQFRDLRSCGSSFGAVHSRKYRTRPVETQEVRQLSQIVRKIESGELFSSGGK